jgi:hypothetical protein
MAAADVAGVLLGNAAGESAKDSMDKDREIKTATANRMCFET